MELRNKPAWQAAWLRERLCCPDCRGELSSTGASLNCAGCGREFVQQSGSALHLMPEGWRDPLPDWIRRQDHMEAWYSRIAAAQDSAFKAFTEDYSKFSDYLESLSGVVLDLGGGNGIARHWLPADSRMVVVDPDLRWLAHGWHRHAAMFPSLAEPLAFIRGVGEALPLATASIDAVLSVFSLNHVVDPARTVQEIARVLRPGGKFLLVLDDVAPSWRELPRLVWKRQLPRRAPMWKCFGMWPRQSDHLAITERGLVRWTGTHFTAGPRVWRGAYLVREFLKW